MRHARNADFLATSKAPERSLLLGSHGWTVHNDSEECFNEGATTYKTNLTLHACDAEQFACDNAFCIPMNWRCNAVEECIDGSDEQDCGRLVMPQGYRKDLTPIPETGHDVLVNFSVNIIKIDVQSSTNIFMTKISYTRNWFDGRLRFKHLKRKTRRMNIFPPAEIEKMWYPMVIFDNVWSKGNVKETTAEDVLEAIPNGNFIYTAENNMYMFEGSENALSLKREYFAEWNCEYKYHWYPFDTQVCRMEFISTTYRTDFHPTDLTHSPDISLSRYTLSKIRMCKTTIHVMDRPNDQKAMVVEVTLGRPIINNLLTVFVPTMLLVVISFTARVFAEEYMDMVIEVNLTILLVLATM